MPKLIRFITSFATVLGAYWLYALVAVPLIEPAATGARGASDGEARRAAARRLGDRLGKLHDLVPPEARAQLQTPWIIESDDVKLLMQKYTNREDGRVKIEPCVLIYTPGSSDDKSKTRPPIVLYAPAGAMMVFSRPLDLRRGDVERPTSGRLLGEITITSPGESQGPEDDLRIVTSDVQLTPDRVSTTNPVQFRYGPSYGSGRNLEIKLLNEEQRPGASNKPAEIQGIEYFELKELDGLHLEPPRKDGPVVVAHGGEPEDLDASGPLEIKCRGPFRFDPIAQYAKFQHQVDVYRLYPEGPADQLNCEMLTLYFARSRRGLVPLDGKEQPPAVAAVEATDLELREIEATGNPVFVRSLRRDAEARGERLVYDVQQKCVTLEQGEEVFLREGINAVRARRIQYTSKGKGRLGEIHSQGPGTIQGEMRDRPGQEFFARWGDQLQLEPYEDQHLATMNGGVELSYSGVGTLNAERIDCWLFEVPEGPGREKPEIVPDRMLIQNQVHIDSPEAVGDVNRMEIWFEQAPEPLEDQATAGSVVTGPSATGASQATSEASSGGLAKAFAPHQPGEPLEKRYKIKGDLAQAQVLLRGDDAELTTMLLAGQVQLDEIPLVANIEPPLHVTGDRIEVTDAHDSARTEISVLGRPAAFRGRGMTLRGTNIKVNNATNRLRIDGSGDMSFPLDRDLKGNLRSRPDMLTVSWQKMMEFDGKKAAFEEKVLARGTDQFLRTEALDVYFTEKIVFRDVQSKDRPEPELEQLVCRGGVFMEGRSYQNVAAQQAGGAAGRYVPVSIPMGANDRSRTEPSWEEFQAKELTIDLRREVFFAVGPGNIRTIRPASSKFLKDRLGGERPGPDTGPGGQKLRYLHVRFPHAVRGNMQQRTATFDGRVECVSDEVTSWQTRLDIDDPDSLSIKGILLSADRLTVAQAPLPVADSWSVELEALGNVIAENATFTARANRMTYSEAKDWLILEGNGYAPAELTFEEYVGAPPRTIPAAKINFRPETKEVSFDSIRALRMDSAP